MIDERVFPPTCVCNPEYWLKYVDKIPKVCRKYKGDGQEQCWHCEHTQECHSGLDEEEE